MKILEKNIMNINKFRSLPDFIGIGAQRTGSTWLYRCLSKHPEIWMPPIKEIHFFDWLDNPTKFSRRKKKYFRDLRKRYKFYKLPRSEKKKNRPNLRWDMNYFLSRRDIQWYSSLFYQGVNKITGEITPEYMMLTKKMVEDIYTYNPKLKIIFIMRDPIDRVWSATIKHLAKMNKRDALEISDEEFLKFIKNRGTLMRTNYLRALTIWESVFPAPQIHIDFFDNIQENPQAVLLQIFEFLGVEANKEYIVKNPHKKVASTIKYKIQIPRAIEVKIGEENIYQLEKLSQRFGGHATKWLARTNKVLENNKKTH
jgi:hypothetical protein